MSRATNLIFNTVGNTIALPRSFIALAGSLNAAVMLAQAVYWTSLYHNDAARDGWFYMTRDDWSDQIGLSRTEQENARKRLKELGVLEEGLRGSPARLFYRVNVDALAKLLANLEPTTRAESAREPRDPNDPRQETCHGSEEKGDQLAGNLPPVGGKPADQLAGNLPTPLLDTKTSPKTSPKSANYVRLTRGDHPARWVAEANGGVAEIPESLAVSERFRQELSDFIHHRQLQRRGALTTLALERILTTFSRFSPEAATRALSEAIEKGWIGFKVDQVERHERDLQAERLSGHQPAPDQPRFRDAAEEAQWHIDQFYNEDEGDTKDET